MEKIEESMKRKKKGTKKETNEVEEEQRTIHISSTLRACSL